MKHLPVSTLKCDQTISIFNIFWERFASSPTSGWLSTKCDIVPLRYQQSPDILTYLSSTVVFRANMVKKGKIIINFLDDFYVVYICVPTRKKTHMLSPDQTRTQVIASFSLCTLVPRLTANLRWLAVACVNLRLIWACSNFTASFFQLARACESFEHKTQVDASFFLLFPAPQEHGK